MDIFKALFEFIEHCRKNEVVFKNAFHRLVVMRDLYFKLYNLADPTKVLGNHLDLIAVTNREGHWESGPIPKRLQDYEEFKIYDKFRLNWSEWVDQPRYMVELQLKLAINSLEKEAARQNRYINEIDDLIKQNKLDPKHRDSYLAMLTKK